MVHVLHVQCHVCCAMLCVCFDGLYQCFFLFLRQFVHLYMIFLTKKGGLHSP